MMLIKLLKRICCSFLMIYSFDVVLSGFNVVVPINFITLLVVTLLGYPGLIMLALSFLLLM